MDGSESIAYEYLLSLDLGEPAFEPNGNTPPDFTIANKLAIEVRRLNQHRELPGGEIEPLDKQTMPLVDRVEGLLGSFEPKVQGESWFVHVSFCRPVGIWRELKPKLEAALRAFSNGLVPPGEIFRVSETIELGFRRAKQCYPSLFVLGGFTDHDSGGNALTETIRALEVCVPEKERKVAPYRDRYPEWWLVLINHIGYRLEADDQVRLRDTFKVPHTFNRIVLVNPLAPADSLVL